MVGVRPAIKMRAANPRGEKAISKRLKTRSAAGPAWSAPCHASDQLHLRRRARGSESSDDEAFASRTRIAHTRAASMPDTCEAVDTHRRGREERGDLFRSGGRVHAAQAHDARKRSRMTLRGAAQSLAQRGCRAVQATMTMPRTSQERSVHSLAPEPAENCHCVSVTVTVSGSVTV
jgi:hypothetical protein